MNDPKMEKIVLEHITYIYGEGTPFRQVALDDVSIAIRENRVTGVIGHTGSGKSTMMQLLNGLAKPTSGKILLDGYDINTEPDEVFDAWRKLPEYAGLSRRAAKKAIREEVLRRRKRLCFRVGLVMQYPEYQLFEETARKDIAYGPTNMGLDQEEIDARVAEAAEWCGISPDLLDRSPFDLSGGQKRRVAIAGVIAMRPEVLILDEPAAGLDPQGRDWIFEGIRAYRKKTGSTVVIVSHSMEDMARYCDDVVVLANAKVILQGDREEVFSHGDQLEESGLDVPQITRLIAMLRRKGFDLPANIYTVDRACEVLLEKTAGRTAE